jgi:hypothetical protein
MQPWPTFRPLRPVREPVDWGSVNRIAAYAAERRAEMGEEAWQRLQQEWQA